MVNKGVYIHIPFCVRKCPYCDFYSITDVSIIEDYVKAVIRNIEYIKRDNITADTIYFGGGTPSLLSAEQLERIISIIPKTKNAEISMEINPNNACLNYLYSIRSAGINRISIGVQSLDDKELLYLGRLHDKYKAINAIINAEKAGFDNISADLILASPYQNMESLTITLNNILNLPLNHISAYMLKIEPNTIYYNNKNILNNIPCEDDIVNLYLHTVNILNNAGFMQYEISNFSRSGYECLHNLKYWKCLEYYGIGSSSHSFINGIRYCCDMTVHEYIRSLNQDKVITEYHGGDLIENIMLKLRLTKTGFNTSEYPEMQDIILNKARSLIKEGYILNDGSVLKLTPKGCLVSNEIIYRLIN